MANEIGIVDQSDLRRYRTEIPNIVFALGLTPFELALYCHLKRTAGAEGKCWKTTKTLAAETGMSGGMISQAKEGLEQTRPELGGKALIQITRDESKPGRPRHIITITDIWIDNFASYQNSPHELQSSPDELQSSYSELQSSPHEPKNKPREEITQEENSLPARVSNNTVFESDNGEGNILLSATKTALKDFAEVYGNVPHIDGQTEIQAEIASHDGTWNPGLWRQVIRQCRGNRTPAKNVGTMLKMYREQAERLNAPPGSGGSRAAPAPPSAVSPERQQTLEQRYKARNHATR